MARILAAALVTMGVGTRLLACEAVLPDHVRVLDCRLAGAVADAAGRSATLNDLLQRVQRSDGLIFITPLPPTGPAAKLLGGFSHDVSVAGSYRVMRIVVQKNTDDSAMAIVGHELRHALEVLEMSSARTEAEVDALYERLGWRTSAHTVETQAALDAGHTIARELRAASKHAHSGG
ncbi:MAG TPA: hypothetical protein VFZ98_07660 [Vicinamibacterales bacterium]